METIIYELWDRDEAYPIIEYLHLDEALAFVAATVDGEGQSAVASWILLRSTPTMAWTEVIGQGADLARLAEEHARGKNS